ncbi:hypothetical protein D3C76_781280 [compost metagenome]
MRELPAGKGAGLFEQVVAGLYQVVHQAQRQALAGIDRLAAEHQCQGGCHADQPWQALGTPGTGQQAQAHLRQAQAGSGAGDPVSAGQGQFQAATQGHTVERGDQRFAEAGQFIQQLG